jgi:LysR family hydrogen peroxide-inducible transcriptional activator
MTGEVTGILKIGCIATVAPYLLPLILYDFSVKYPGLSLEIKESTTDEIVSLIKSRELDTGIISTPLNDKELIEYPVYREPFVLYDTSGIHSGGCSLRDMSWDNFWLLEEGHCLSDQILEICSSGNSYIKSPSSIHFKTGSIDSLVRFVKTYKGQTLLPSLAVRNFREEDRRHLVRFVQPAPSRTIGLVVHQHFANKQILELLQNEIRLKTALLNDIEVISP